MKVGRDYFSLVNNAAAGAWAADADGNVALTPGFLVPLVDLQSSVYTAPVVGVAGYNTVTLASTYVAGDEVTLTVVSNDTSRQLWRKTYRHTAQAGAVTVTDIATALTALIAKDGEANETPYTATNVAGVITITQKNDDKNSLQVEVYTTSVAGTIVAVATATVISEGYPDDLVDRGIDAADITSATFDTVRIVYTPSVAQPFINSVGSNSVEIFWFGTEGDGATTGGFALDALINA